MGLADITRAGMDHAIAEHHQLGRDRFLLRYGFSASRTFVIRSGDHLYDSKAIVGVAHRFDRPDEGALDAGMFSGGRGHAVDVAERLGFTILEGIPKHDMRGEDGALVGATCEVNADALGWAFTLHSRGGKKGTDTERNPGYTQGLRIALRRLVQIDATITEVLLDSTTMAAVEIGQRQLLDRVPARLSKRSHVESIVSEIMTTAARTTATGVRSSGGNPTKQVRVRFVIEGTTDLHTLTSTLVGVDMARYEYARPGDEVTDGLVEGALKRTTVNQYERDPKARRACIAHYGSTCQVCSFDFGATFGALGEGYIHVHHRIPIASIGKEYVIDPVKDLVPLCPNCHAMIHLRSPEPFSVHELRTMMLGRVPDGPLSIARCE